MVRPITENDLGLEVLYDGTTEPDAHDPVDIVAVHGMGAHPDDTWCSQVPDQDPPAYVNWLKDKQFLPASVPHARIMRYGYSSQWFGKNATKTKMSDISQAFLFDLDEFREDKNRPLILIGHSFGGLVLLKVCASPLYCHTGIEPATQWDRMDGQQDESQDSDRELGVGWAGWRGHKDPACITRPVEGSSSFKVFTGNFAFLSIS
ncbi:hypothetical protein RB598_006708 [Gaeumannomyces tritici]